MNAITCPEWATDWKADEAAECLPGMLKSGAYNALWEEMPRTGTGPTLAEIWHKLIPAHQQAIIDGYIQEYEK